MPFKSKLQTAKCYAMKARGQGKGWDCKEWAEHTDFKRLPERAAKSAEWVGDLAKRAAQLLLGR